MKINFVINNIVLEQIRFTSSVKHKYDKINKNFPKGDLVFINSLELIRLCLGT